MEVKGALQLVVVLLSAALNCARAAEVKRYFEKGGSMVLEPKVDTTITNILWKHNGNLLAEWFQTLDEPIYYDTFKGRTSLSKKGGRLEMTNITKDDTGQYTLEINSIVHGESYAVKVIKEVPQPSVWKRPLGCTRDSENCTLVCEGPTKEDTTEAEPITYSWRKDGEEWFPSEELPIGKGTSATKTFSCRMKNPVSMKESKPEENPFYEEPRPTPPPSPSSVGGTVAAILFPLLAVAVAVAGVWYNRDRIMAWIRSVRANNNSSANGNPPAENVNASTTETEKLKGEETSTASV